MPSWNTSKLRSRAAALLFRRNKNIAIEKQTRLNEEITSTEIRLIDAGGAQVGVVSLQEAQKIAEEAELDLVEIVPNVEPPVCRVMDYGKYLFNLNKKKHAAKRKQKQIQVKEIKFRPGTDEGDYQIKLRNLTKFLTNGDKVKITLRFRGREMAHQELGAKMLERIEADLAVHGAVEQYPKLEGRQMVMVMAPKK
ncbi:MAG: translation initiation factor IF-3 [Gammaproteobacteria bacterium]